MTTSTVQPEIVRFAAGVRAALADLPAEEVDDLTEGLEADLAESLAEDLRRTLPDPVAYAAELRLAAGLPGRVPRPTVRNRLADVWRDEAARTRSAIADNPALASFVDFVLTLRPAWWIVRAWIATWLLAALFGEERGFAFEPVWFVPLLGATIVSVQWGRGRWQFTGLRQIVVIGNIVAAVALVPVLAAADSNMGDTYYETDYADPGAPTAEGLSMDGQPVTNIYAYDSAGNKLTGVQLFDVDGKPIVPLRDTDVTSILQTPATLETGVEAYNVYPLAVAQVIWDSYGEMVPDPNADPAQAAAYANGPFVKVPAVQPPAAAQPAQPVAPPNE